MYELKSCPFCESEDVELITGKGKFDRVRCKSCGATGPWYDGHPEDAVSDWNYVSDKILKKKNKCPAQKNNPIS